MSSVIASAVVFLGCVLVSYLLNRRSYDLGYLKGYKEGRNDELKEIEFITGDGDTIDDDIDIESFQPDPDYDEFGVIILDKKEKKLN